MTGELPTGVVTFLFTDIEGSTHLLQRLGDRYPAVLEDHFALLRTAFGERGGREVGPRGDALFVAFASAADAVAASVDSQLALHRHPWPADGRIRVRIGMHTGEAVVQHDDYVGLAVHQAARICAAGNGGQVLLSEETLRAAGSLPRPVEAVDIGLHRLKDLPDALRLFQISHPELPEATTKLRVDATPGNLPKQITSFVGRKDEQQEVAGLLDAGSRLVTLTGPGGCGKTRLAIQVAADVVDRYPHGAWLIDLAAVREADLVDRSVAAALGVTETSGRSIVSGLLDHLTHRRVLLILDNCEHLVASCAELVDVVLRSTTDVQIIATSQEALGILGEAVVRVPSLPDADAVQLFADRAALRSSDFAVDDANAELVAAICRRLDGIPLAIELAAARIPVLSLRQIADRLDDQFRLLTGGSRNAVPRQQTLRAAVEWSYSLLTEPERVVLRRVAVFAGGWTIDAAGVVAGDGPNDPAILDVLDRLVARSLVVAEEQDGVARYRLLESIRLYAQERLAEATEVADVRERHLQWFHALALRAEPELTGADQAAWFERLAREYDNLRAAMEWCAAQPDAAEDLLSLTSALWRFWLVRGHWGEGRTWLDRALAATDGLRTATRARALAASGDLATQESDIDTAEALLAASLELWEELGDPEGVATVLNHQGNLARARFEYDTARGLLNHALELREKAGDERGVAVALRNLGLLAALQRDHETAAGLYKRALPIARALHDKRVQASLTHALAMVAFENSDPSTARSLAEEGLRLDRELGDQQGIAEQLTVLSGVHACAGDDTAAASMLDEAIALWRSLGARDALARTHTTLGGMAISVNNFDVANAHLAQAVREWRRLNDASAMASVLNLAGWAAMMRADYALAGPLLDEAVVRARVTQDAVQLSSSLHSLGELRRLEGRGAEATALLDESFTVASDAGWRHLLWWPSLSLAALARTQGDVDGATDLLGRAIALCPKLARESRQADCADELGLLLDARADATGAAHAIGAADATRQSLGLSRAPAYAIEIDALAMRLPADELAIGRSIALDDILTPAEG